MSTLPLLLSSLLVAAGPLDGDLTQHGCFAATEAGDAIYCVTHYRYGDATAEAVLVRLTPRERAHRVKAIHTMLYDGIMAAPKTARDKLMRTLRGQKPALVTGGLVALKPTTQTGKRTSWVSPDGKTHLETHDRWEAMTAVAFRDGLQEQVSRVRLAGDPDAPWKVNQVWWLPGSRTWVIEVVWTPERPDPDFQLETGVFFLRAPGD